MQQIKLQRIQIWGSVGGNWPVPLKQSNQVNRNWRSSKYIGYMQQHCFSLQQVSQKLIVLSTKTCTNLHFCNITGIYCLFLSTTGRMVKSSKHQWTLNLIKNLQLTNQVCYKHFKRTLLGLGPNPVASIGLQLLQS